MVSCSGSSQIGIAKHAGEQAVLETDIIVRTGWIYGATGRNFLNTILERMLRGEGLKVVADQFGSPTWSQSIACALVELVEAGSSGIHHFTDQGRASWYDFAVEIGRFSEAMGLLPSAPEVIPIKSSEYEQQAERPANSVLDCEKTYGELSQSPPFWQENLKRALAEFEVAN